MQSDQKIPLPSSISKQTEVTRALTKIGILDNACFFLVLPITIYCFAKDEVQQTLMDKYELQKAADGKKKLAFTYKNAHIRFIIC